MELERMFIEHAEKHLNKMVLKLRNELKDMEYEYEALTNKKSSNATEVIFMKAMLVEQRYKLKEAIEKANSDSAVRQQAMKIQEEVDRLEYNPHETNIYYDKFTNGPSVIRNGGIYMSIPSPYKLQLEEEKRKKEDEMHRLKWERLQEQIKSGKFNGWNN